MSIREFWRRITSTRYTRRLETEVALLRAENRALLNSILGIAGIPPIPMSEPDPLLTGSGDSAISQQPASSLARNPRLGAGALSNVAAPMRRRSWQQINRALEFESARKKSQETGN
jgi:hypothetical protein